MRDRSKKLLVINTGKKESEQAGMTAQPGVTHIIGGGGMSVNMSDYLLKSIWDKVWEIRTDSAGTDYIFGKLPVVLQYGLTMYSGEGADIPTLASGLPFDGRTIWYNPDTQQIEVIGGTGGGSGEGVSNFWDLSGIPSWITNSKPKYSYSEIEGTPDLSVYAQVDTLKAYVTLAGAQTLTGEKNFTGGLKVNGSPIIYDSVNKYWKLQGNLVLTGGITMYADDGTLNLPSIYDGLPIDGTTIYWDTDAAGNRVIKAVIGGGTADSVAWNNITGKPSWIGSSKPTYSYSEIQNTPDLSRYALQTALDTTNTEVAKKWTKDNSKIANWDSAFGWGNHANAGYVKKTYVDETFVNLTGDQTISGKKNFTTGGLFVNGSQIKYDSTKKYWKLEGDLLVTGGITMYGNEGTYTPSTIMDAIVVDETTISKSGGVLKVIGGTGGGVADSVAWVNITGKPTWIGSSKPTYSYSEVTGAISTTELQNYLTSNSYLNVTSGDNRYLQLSGGTITGSLEIKCGADNKIVINNTDGEGYSRIVFQENGSYIGQLLSTKDGNIHWGESKIWHSGNFNPSNYLPLSGGTMTGNILLGGTTTNKIGTNIVDTSGGFQEFTHQNSNGYIALGPFNGSVAHIYTDRPSFYFNKDLYVNDAKVWHAGNDGSGSSLDADLLDGKHNGDLTAQYFSIGKILTSSDTINKLMSGVYCYINGDNPVGSVGDNTILLSFRNDVRTDTFQLANSANDHSLYYRSASNIGNSYENWSSWRAFAFIDSNVASATKLQTARTIWGQSFDGTGNVSGDISNLSTIVFDTSLGAPNIGYLWTNTKGMHMDMSGLGTEQQGTNLTLTPYGNVGIGTSNPISKCDINGLLSIRLESSSAKQSSLNLMNTSSDLWQLSARYGTSDNGNFNIYYYNGSTWAKPISINKNGNLLSTGGITMYSDQRKKTILNHVELSLKQIADAPLIEHYYNGDEKKTTHVGSIAQYWASMNDWFCKLDSEGYYTMEIQNAALASAISVARELVKFENETDKRIRLLEEENKELRNEIERLKAS